MNGMETNAGREPGHRSHESIQYLLNYHKCVSSASFALGNFRGFWLRDSVLQTKCGCCKQTTYFLIAKFGEFPYLFILMV